MQDHTPDSSSIIRSLVPCAFEAGRRIMDIYSTGFEVSAKDDDSPVTDADHASEAIILEHLAARAPGLQVISEEQHALAAPTRIARTFFLVDPLDGTREFVNRNGEFTVNIALVHDRVPIAGIVYAPAIGRFFIAGRDIGAFEIKGDNAGGVWEPISVRRPPDIGLTVIASRSHGDPALETYLRDFTVVERISAGSSLKFCNLACGQADLYPRHGRTMEWDTAAGQAVLECAGGSVTTFDGTRLRYAKTERGLDNPGFVARGWQ